MSAPRLHPLLRLVLGAVGPVLLLAVVPLAYFAAIGFSEVGLFVLGLVSATGGVGCLVSGRHALTAAIKGTLNADRRLVALAGVCALVGVAVLGRMAVSFGASHDRAFVVAMKSDLRNLADSQQDLHRRTGRYAADPAELARFVPSTGVTLTIERADSAGWRAVARHERIREACSMEVTAGRPAEAAPLCEGRFRPR